MQTAAQLGISGRAADGHTALAASWRTLPGVSAPSSVVKSSMETARRMPCCLASALIERLASVAARSSTATRSTCGRRRTVRTPRRVSPERPPEPALHAGARGGYGRGMPPVRRRADEPAESVLAERQEPPPEPAVLALQRSAGNAAVAQLLAREPWVVSPGAPSVRDPLGAGDAVQHALADWTAAIDAVQVWFDKTAEPHREHGNIPGSVAELVHQASLLPYTTGDGGQGVVGDKAKPPEIEDRIRGRARTLGLRLTEHRDASDVAGVRSELGAIMANLGAIPTQVSYGDDDAKITASLTGKVTGEAKLGKVKVEGELSPDGAEGSMTLPGGGRITGHGGPEGGGAKVKVPGAEFGLEVGGKGIKAEVKAGDL